MNNTTITATIDVQGGQIQYRVAGKWVEIFLGEEEMGLLATLNLTEAAVSALRTVLAEALPVLRRNSIESQVDGGGQVRCPSPMQSVVLVEHPDHEVPAVDIRG
ncbi:hypothetical protein [Actinokineospora sp. NBRC 105648]|uniref:hypothetical protein n=1 Tax=Actinokineospora sp. NBRC 105648 TaxID=3032206 RepID=UPI0024A5ACD0|nr:hypothetical protein [Actinokineospora sp. NBRC 105648]GLZ43203.1 hypothetical protein Acsp05_68270 [Actinokineospora sp. NBRC 105648]